MCYIVFISHGFHWRSIKVASFEYVIIVVRQWQEKNQNSLNDQILLQKVQLAHGRRGKIFSMTFSRQQGVLMCASQVVDQTLCNIAVQTTTSHCKNYSQAM